MSLISPKNFTAPFTNRVHFIALVLTAVLFAAFRLAGGTVSVRERNASAVRRSEITSNRNVPTPRSALVPTSGARSAPSGGDEDAKDFEALLRDAPPIPSDEGFDDGVEAAEPSRAARGGGAAGAGSLDDIEKQLGLR